MAKARVLVVEDENIIAEDLRHILQDMGYAVPALVASGEEAVQKAAKIHPDLVLMDIVLKGAMDGIEAADQIRACWNIPVIYLTAYSDDATLERAKRTEPFGYLVKPFAEREVHTTIQLALYKHTMEEKRKESKEQVASKRKRIGNAVRTTDALPQSLGEAAYWEDVVREPTQVQSQRKGRLRQLIRCHQILDRLARRPVDYNANLLAEELGFTTKTIYRDLRALKEAGVVIAYDRSRKRYLVEKSHLARAYVGASGGQARRQEAGFPAYSLRLTEASRHRGHQGESCADAIRAVMKLGGTLPFSELFSRIKQMGSWSDHTIWQRVMSLVVNLPPARHRWTNTDPFLFLHGDGRFELYDRKVHPQASTE